MRITASTHRRLSTEPSAPGPVGQTIEVLLEQWPVVLPRLEADLLAGTYRPGEIRRAYSPKAGGGQRGLGIPDVIVVAVSGLCSADLGEMEP